MNDKSTTPKPVKSIGVMDHLAVSLELHLAEAGLCLPDERAYVIDVGCGAMPYWNSLISALSGDAMISGTRREVSLVGIDNDQTFIDAGHSLLTGAGHQALEYLYFPVSRSNICLLKSKISGPEDISKICTLLEIPRVDLVMALGIGPKYCNDYVKPLIKAIGHSCSGVDNLLLGLTGECYEAEEFMSHAKTSGFTRVVRLIDPLWKEQHEQSRKGTIEWGRRVPNPINEYIVAKKNR
jgi:hypothetical protein